MSRRCLHKQSYQFYTRPTFNFPVDGLPVGITACYHPIFPNTGSFSTPECPLPAVRVARVRPGGVSVFPSIRYAINVQIEDAARPSLSATITNGVPEVGCQGLFNTFPKTRGCLTNAVIFLSPSLHRSMKPNMKLFHSQFTFRASISVHSYFYSPCVRVGLSLSLSRITANLCVIHIANLCTNMH